MGTSVILDYNVHYKKTEKINKRHWHILQMDRLLGTILPKYPKCVYRRAPTVKDKMVKSVLDLPKQSTTLFPGIEGFFACGKCLACKDLKYNVNKKKKGNHGH